MKRLPETGYTILEVMIFLAITGVLFASAAVAIGGSQRQAQYSQSVRDLEIQIKDVANDVANGFYPSYTTGRCTKTTGSDPQVQFVDIDQPGVPGSSQGCVNVGKIMMFDVAGKDDSFGVGTLVGANPGIGESNDLTPASLNPTLAYTTANVTGSQVDLTTYKPIRFSAEVTKIGTEGSNQTYSSLIFISNFGSAGTTNKAQNGLLKTDVYGVRGSLDSTGRTLDQYKNIIEGLGDSSTAVDINPPDGYYVCLLTTDNRKARVIIGIDGNVTATKTEFDLPDSGGPC